MAVAASQGKQPSPADRDSLFIVGKVSAYPVSISTSPGGVRLLCSQCGELEVLLLEESEIARHVPVFLERHPAYCAPAPLTR